MKKVSYAQADPKFKTHRPSFKEVHLHLTVNDISLVPAYSKSFIIITDFEIRLHHTHKDEDLQMTFSLISYVHYSIWK